jgi:hypothetical protein
MKPLDLYFSSAAGPGIALGELLIQRKKIKV